MVPTLGIIDLHPQKVGVLTRLDDLEMLDDIKPDLVNLTLSDSYLSNFSLDSKLTTTSDDCQIKSDENEAAVNCKNVLHLASPQSQFASLEDLKQKDCSQQLGLLDNLLETSLTELNGNERLSTPSKICRNHGNPSFKRSPNLKCMLPIQNRMAIEKGKSSSLQDLHRLTSSPLLDKCHSVSSVRPIYSPSVSKSKDSGLPLSLSRLSLHSTDKSYENVQSKVKEYISNLKEEGRHRKTTQSSVEENICYSSDDWEYSEEIKLDPHELLSTISMLRTELQDKDEMLRNLQDSYSALLMLHAETKNRIDQLRFDTKGSDRNMPQSLTVMKKLQTGSDNTNLNSKRLLTLEGLNSTKKNILSPESRLSLDQELSDCLQCSTEESILKVHFTDKLAYCRDFLERRMTLSAGHFLDSSVVENWCTKMNVPVSILGLMSKGIQIHLNKVPSEKERMEWASLAYETANALIVLSSTAEDGEIEAWNNVLTYLSEVEVCARQMKGRSEAIKRVLLERLTKSASNNS
uniref:Uncharacterized protein n=1 Tax=Timema monikensis TaxID=170555 RepID=A0A7R9DZ10_9NEOP|nr:unnamed protein product [Timema monikensis]